ncbi:MAG: hypothetical protein MJE66_11460 [Proteobacteria bacterium]|nr:hypothetical protein [Pseudomonadota bacterium]
MARNRLPDAIKRRHLLERELTASDARQTADAYLEAGRAVEALPFLHMAGAEDELRRLVEEAIAAGDAFLLRSVATVAGWQPTVEQWRALAQEAEAAGKERYAETALAQVERLTRGQEGASAAD